MPKGHFETNRPLLTKLSNDNEKIYQTYFIAFFQEYDALVGLFVEILQENCKDPSSMVPSVSSDNQQKLPKNNINKGNFLRGIDIWSVAALSVA